MKKKARFLSDVDGVAANFVASAIRVMNDVSGQSITEENITMWDVLQALDDPEHRPIAQQVFNQQGFCTSIQPYEGAVEAMKYLHAKTELHFVTAPMYENYHWMPERMQWAITQFGVSHKRVHFMYEKHIASGDFFLEDSDVNANEWVKHHENGTCLLWDRPWNRVNVDPRIIRVHSWEDVMRIVSERS